MTEPTPGKFPTLTVNDDDFTIVVNGFCIDRVAKKYITIIFRQPSAKDAAMIRKTYGDTDSGIDPDLKVLSNLCIKFGTDDTFTTGELEVDEIPFSHVRWLKKAVIDQIFPDMPT